MRLILLQINQKKLLFTCKVFVNKYVIAVWYGYNDFDIFYKTEPSRSDMDVNWDSKTHLSHTFFNFLSRFVRVWL